MSHYYNYPYTTNAPDQIRSWKRKQIAALHVLPVFFLQLLRDFAATNQLRVPAHLLVISHIATLKLRYLPMHQPNWCRQVMLWYRNLLHGMNRQARGLCNRLGTTAFCSALYWTCNLTALFYELYDTETQISRRTKSFIETAHNRQHMAHQVSFHALISLSSRVWHQLTISGDRTLQSGYVSILAYISKLRV